MLWLVVFTQLKNEYSTWNLVHNQLAVVVQRYLLIQYIVGTQPVGCYIEVVCLYSGTCI